MRFALVCLVVALSTGCRPVDTWTRVELALDDEGEPRFVARRQTYRDGVQRDFLYAERRDGAWQLEWIAVGAESYDSDPYYGTPPSPASLIIGPQRTWLVADLASGTRVYEKAGDGRWQAVPIAAELPAGAAMALHTTDAFGGAWLGSDGELRILAGEWLIETRDDRLTVAEATGAGCTVQSDFVWPPVDVEQCHFLPSGDREGDAVGFVLIPAERDVTTSARRLACADTCAWEAAADPGFGAVADSTYESWEDHVVFRTVDGALHLAHRGRPSGLRVVGGGEERTFPLRARLLGAAPRPSGGYVVASHDPPELVVVAVDGAREQPFSVDVPRPRLGGERIGLIVAPASAIRGELAHIVVPTTSTTFLHVTIDLSSGATERETIGW